MATMVTFTVKEQARELVEKLPDDCTWNDLMDRIYVILAVEAGLSDSEIGRTQSVDEVRLQFDLPV